MNMSAFLITTMAGFATVFGFFALWYNKQEDIIAKALGLSAGVMIAVPFVELLPNSLQYLKNVFFSGFYILFCILFFLLGILFSIMIEEGIHKRVGEGNTLFQIGILSMIAIILHNIPEGIITYLTTSIEFKPGLLLAISIALHNIPEGICIAIPIYYSTKRKWKSFQLVFIAALSEPLGALIAYFYFSENLSTMAIGIFLALVAGIMVSLSVIDILPEAKKYSFKHTFIYFWIGIGIFLVSHLLF